MKKNIIIAGAGGIGQAAGLILAVSNEMDVKIYIGDIRQKALDKAEKFISEGSGKKGIVEGFLMPPEGKQEDFDKILEKGDIILDCLPGSLAPKMAELCIKHKLHYANLTEYVDETNQIIDIAKGAETGFVLQTGVAPGFVNILGNYLYKDFQSKYNSDKLELLEMKVGALSQNSSAPHFYAFTWSPIGVATEYVKDSVIVKDHEIAKVASLSNKQELVLDGIRYEDNFTSGGVADFPDAFKQNIKNITYKTLRHLGHYDWVQSQLIEIGHVEKPSKILEKRMLEQIPTVENDHIIIYCRVKGNDSDGRLRAIDKVIHVYPQKVGNKTLRAIQSTTAAPLCECARMLLSGEMKTGINLQSQIDPESFIKGPYVNMIYGDVI